MRYFPGIPPIQRSLHSYTNPNASCPVCGASVFFYQSPNGGRVFFDELGPPWPKHPCTNRKSEPALLPKNRISGDRNLRKPQYGWKEHGWIPFFVEMVISLDKEIIRIVGELAGEYQSLFAIKVLDPKTGRVAITKNSIVYVRKKTEAEFELSFIDQSGNNKDIRCFTKVWGARGQARTEQQNRRNTGRSSSKMKQSRTTKKKGDSPTAIEIAFKKAKDHQQK